ncbi:MAG: multiprotein bridging factor aMBF1 [archaeon]|nr:multiprotein bridging factor aMBF1 [archaeon]
MEICEMCGKEVPLTKLIFIEGTKLSVCQSCLKFGDEYRGSSSKTSVSTPIASAQVIEQRLQKRKMRMQTKDVYRGVESVELVANYGSVIRNARISKGMDLDQFAVSILEKKGTLAKIESEDLAPDDKIIKKLEKALGIKLTETVTVSGRIGYGRIAKMSLADFIRKS